MFNGLVIDQLMEMVARVEDHARDARVTEEPVREEQLLASHFAYRPTESQAMMIGVA